jgi:hypothetical protein
MIHSVKEEIVHKSSRNNNVENIENEDIFSEAIKRITT